MDEINLSTITVMKPTENPQRIIIFSFTKEDKPDDVTAYYSISAKGKEEEGYLSIVSDQELPFEIKRVFWAYGTPEHEMRGKHAHKKDRDGIDSRER